MRKRRTRPSSPPRPLSLQTTPRAAGLPQMPGAPFAAPLDSGQLLRLQRTVGNQRLARHLARSRQPARIQRTLTLDEQPIERHVDVPEEQRELISQQLFTELDLYNITGARELLENIVTSLINESTAVQCSLPELAELALMIGRVYMLGDTVSNPLAQSIGTQLMHNEERLQNPGVLGKRLGMAGTSNGVAALDLLEQKPGFQNYLVEQGIKFHFASADAKNMGGMYSNRVVHIEEKLRTETRSVFLRTLIHEIGHATFQQRLLKDKLDSEVSKGKFGDLIEKYQRINQAINFLVTSNEQDRSEVQKLQEKINKLTKSAELIDQNLSKFDADGLEFYNAWLVLRQNDGMYMLGVDLGSVMSAPGRLGYQAAKFEEFCAESFMHVVQEPQALRQHFETLRSNQDVPQEVIQAWEVVLRILVKHRTIIVG